MGTIGCVVGLRDELHRVGGHRSGDGEGLVPARAGVFVLAPEEPDDAKVRTGSRCESRAVCCISHCDPPLRGSRTFTTRRVYVWKGSELKLLRSEDIGRQ